MLYESTCGTIAKKSFPSSPWGSKFLVAKFGRTEAIKQNSKTRSSKLSCQHQQARNLFTIEGATPIEVTVPSNVITLATPSKTTQNVPHHVDSRGPRMVGEVHSSSDWLAPRAGANLRQATVKIVCKHGLRNVARAAWAARSRSPFMQD